MNSQKFIKEITDYGKSNAYIPTAFNLLSCSCGHQLFKMFSDDEEGGCGILCAKCDEGISVEGSADYMEDVAQNTCTCGSEELYVMVGKSFYRDATDVRWVYVGGMCPVCDLSGVYVDWAER